MNLRSILLEAIEFEDGSCDKISRVGIRVAQAELGAEANPLASALARKSAGHLVHANCSICRAGPCL
ncbi:MAG: hypothetical protein AAGF51_15570, partial [Pseudomonadota bacterium]